MKHPWRGMPCAVCRKTSGYFDRATYDGAPEGGVTVHSMCLQTFFERLQNEEWKREMDAEYRRWLAIQSAKSVT